MKFLILTQYFLPEIGATSIRLFEIAKELRRQGHEVEVITAMPNYPQGKTFSEYRGKMYLKEEIEGIPVIRTWIYPATGKGIKRLLNFFSFTFTSFFGLLKARKPDYIFIESPPLFLGISGYLASRLKRVPYILNVADLWLDAIVELGIVKKRVPLWLAKRLELFLYKRAFIINGVTEGILEGIAKNIRVTVQKVFFLPNGVNSELFKPLPQNKELATILNVHGKKVFLYAGIHGYAQGLETLLEAASLLQGKDDIAFLLVGDGPEKPHLQRAAQNNHLANVIFASPYSYGAMPDIFSLACASIVTLRKLKILEEAKPSKIMPPLACGIPIIYSGSGEGASFIEEGQCGLVVEPETPQALAEAVVRIADDPQLASELGRNGRELVEKEYSWKTIVSKWLESLEAKQNERRLQLKEPFLKRPFDFSLALLGLVLSSPLWLVFSLAIYMEDGGPVFFPQERCGKGGKVFRAIKFRTMKEPKKGEARLDVDLEHDPRLTRVGKLLRATALDELPELINILKGEMSFVGPRPLPYKIEDEEISRYKTIDEVPGYHLRSQVRPGLTGIAQIYAPKDVDRQNKFCYDNLYIKKQGFWLDQKLLFLSSWVTFRGRWERRGRKF